MNMEIRSLIREMILEIFQEAKLTFHVSKERLNQRFLNPFPKKVGFEEGVGNYIALGTKVIPSEDQEEIKRRLEIIENYNFPKNKSYAIKLYDLFIRPETVDFYSPEDKFQAKNKTLVYMDEETKSYGNQMYIIIRQNDATTIMFVSSYSALSNQKFDVDFIVKDFNKVIQKQIR